MLKVAKGLDKIEENERAGGGDFFDSSINERDLTRVMSKSDSAKIRFLQELDPDSDLYDEDYGLGFVADEYEHPDVFWFKIADVETEDGSPSWVARQASNKDETRRWKLRRNLYINVAVIKDDGTAEVFFINRGAYGKGLGAAIVESARTRGKLTDTVWSLKKVSTGSAAKDVEYKLSVIDFTDEPLPVEASELIDLENEALRVFEADEQEDEARAFEQRYFSKNDSGSSNGAAQSGSEQKSVPW